MFINKYLVTISPVAFPGFITDVSCSWSTGISVYPLICAIRDLVLIPVRCAFTVADYASIFLQSTIELLKDVWQSISVIFQVANLSSKKLASDTSIWQGLWKDLFSQVLWSYISFNCSSIQCYFGQYTDTLSSQIFRATRSIVNGMSAFFLACNRHRLRYVSYLNSAWPAIEE